MRKYQYTINIKLLLLLFLMSFSVKGNNPPNIVFFVADDMTRDMFNFLPEGVGKNLTPNLDKLSEEGTQMMGQHVSATVCTPSRYNVLTGNYASRASNPLFLKQTQRNEGQRVVEWNTHIIPGEQNLASLLKKAGYRTGAVGKNHVIEVEGYVKVPLSADAGNKKVMKQQLSNYEATIRAYHACGFDFAKGIYYENPDFNGPRDLAVHNLDWSTQAALEFLDEDNKKPFFLYFATTLPHGPQDAKRAWNADRRITPIGILDHAPDVMPHQSSIPKRLREANLIVNDKKANLLWMDDAIGALLKKLEETNKLDNTIIFFFNDHGQFAKGSIYQGATHNPSVVWKKGGFVVGNTSNTMVSNVDFLPTILDMAKVRFDSKTVDGQSFSPVLAGREEDARESMYFEIGYSRGIRKGNFKYIVLQYPSWVQQLTNHNKRKILEDYNKKLALRGKKANNLDPAAPFGHVQIIPGGGDAEFPATKRYPYYSDAVQLYDLNKDPNEQNNLAEHKEFAKLKNEMHLELMKYVSSIPGSFGEMKQK